MKLSRLRLGVIGQGDSTARLLRALAVHGLEPRYQVSAAELSDEFVQRRDIDVWLLDLPDSEWSEQLDALMDNAPVPIFFNEHGAIDRQMHPEYWCRNLVQRIEELVGDPELEPLLRTPAPEPVAAPAQAVQTAAASSVIAQQLLQEIAELEQLLQPESATPLQSSAAEEPPELRFDDAMGLDEDGAEAPDADAATRPSPLVADYSFASSMVAPPYEDMSPQLAEEIAADIDAMAADDDIPVVTELLQQQQEIEAEAAQWREETGSSVAVDDEAALPVLDTSVEIEEFAAPVANLPCDLWVLGSSLGGPAALKRFFTALVEPVPVCFLIAQHIDGHFVPVLAKILEQANAFYQVHLLNRPGLVEAGSILLTPTDKRLRFLEAGQIVQTNSIWSPPYAPSIDDVLLDAAQAYPGRVHTIIFSGMGEDGVNGVKKLFALGGMVWAQDSDSCASAVMPEGAVNTGLVQLRGTPEQMAAALIAHYLPAEANADQA